MIKLLKVKSFSTKRGAEFENKETFNKLKQEFYKNPKIGDYVFCSIEEDKLRGLEWRLYQDIDNTNVYEQWQKWKKDSCHYGLKLDKFTNVFNGREESVNKKIDQSIHLNIDDYLKEDKNLYENIDFNVKVFDKLVVGLGEHSVFETDIKLHHTYGVPYIPASAVKGCFRSHIIQKYFQSKEKKAEEDKNFIEIFGGEYKDKTYSGNVIFIDLFPKNSFEIKKDVMTPHYQNGYTDDGNITPIEFLTVENTLFRFILRISNKCLLQDNNSKIKLKENQDVRDLIVEELVEMIATHGIGAKTSVGYGYFEEVTKEECLEQTENNEKRREEEILEAKEKKKLMKMNDSEKKLYLVEKISDCEKRKEGLRKLFTNRKQEELEQTEIEKLAKLIKRDLEDSGKWRYKIGKKGKKNKELERIEKICEILNIDLPKNSN
ncbi:type III-B CRISPR module RAMP protein Cmr6 [Clostridium botulinum]|uniref:CRISPR-associated RAMP protein, Cmr6 family n=1 Tax=Clostridium botulinum (strain Langeland / NCTC 10281 / Type F) TaxID=441772 RepID=A7GFA5_CLOBL|nr:type III-B CRISPR module RAMP protein Cmr6 [Clostridium botulinum]ABS39314.1 CRISPR-associated RAMP protein, Cmr6 family [Clostridium botulinum F str. Langeland]ADF99868.1 CRISPR-associated RAMP protein, Cmr6 family [Clostridium botulinum F str. 230613]KKM42559.1 CRISPR-associated protein Cmr6 [Clostridium botulinum]MBY6792956.1 type III-B CRISPR module RAMP protein Cmr6 [Clostridium botulinum]MBY6937165.1 type III-B CRISPR module RAMP protein Cmr6 [Clostridium botulinum]